MPMPSWHAQPGRKFAGMTSRVAALAVVTALAVTAQAQAPGGGQVLAWGSTEQGEGTVPPDARPASGMSAVAAGATHSLAVTAAGQVVAWGSTTAGQSSVPLDAMSDYVIMVAGGSQHSLALTRTGRVIAWGGNSLNQTRLPAELALFSVTSISAGDSHSLALTSTGRVIAWGSSVDRLGNPGAQAIVPKAAMANIIAISAGQFHSLALTSTGTVLAWGSNEHNQSIVPPEALTDIMAISAGGEHSLAVTRKGRVISWGRNTESQSLVPEEVLRHNITAVASGSLHSLALTNTGRVIAWGNNSKNQTKVPHEAQGSVTMISASGLHSLALLGPPSHVCVGNVGWEWGVFDQWFAAFYTSSIDICCDLCYDDPNCYSWYLERGQCHMATVENVGPGFYTSRWGPNLQVVAGTRYGDMPTTVGYTAIPNTYYNCTDSDIVSGLDSTNTCHDLDCCQSLCNNNMACNWFMFATGQPQCNAATGGCCWIKKGTLCPPANGTSGAKGYTSYLKTAAPVGYDIRPNTRHPCLDDTPAGLTAAAVPACSDINCCRSLCDSNTSCVLFEFAYGLEFCNGGGGCCWLKGNLTCGGLDTTLQATANPSFISYLKKPECPQYPGYTSYSGSDLAPSGGQDIRKVAPETVLAECNKDCACAAFTSYGWMKTAASPVASAGPFSCFYTKDNFTACGSLQPPFPAVMSGPPSSPAQSEDSSGVNVALAVGLAVGLGGVALLAITAAVVIVKRRQNHPLPDLVDSSSTTSGPPKGAVTLVVGPMDGPQDGASGLADSSDATTSNENSPQPTSLVNTQTAEEINVRAVFLELAQQTCKAKPHVSLKGLAITPNTPLVDGLTLDVDISKDVILQRIIGEGGCGPVHRGRYKDADVAIKTLPATDNMYVQELGILGRMRHPNVVSLLGAGVKGKQVYLILELADSSLDKLMYSHIPPFTVAHTTPAPTTQSVPGRLLPLPAVVAISIQIALGLSYLHPTIIHRDLKPANILVNKPKDEDSTSPPEVKLSDFGLARMMASVTLQTGNPAAGTIAYMAPECFNKGHEGLTCKCDIYSFGMCLWELLHGQPPWYQVDPGLVLFRVVLQHIRPAFSASSERCPSNLRTLIEACWGPDPGGRPSADDVVVQLANILKTLDQS